MKRLALVLGDPAGIGPEIALKVLSQKEKISDDISILVVADRVNLEKQMDDLDIHVRFDQIVCDRALIDSSARFVLYDCRFDFLDGFRYGEIQPECGIAAYIAAETASKLILDGYADCMVTCPLNKQALRNAGYKTIGYTELLADFTKSEREGITMFNTLGLKIFFLTRHLSLRGAIDALNQDMFCDFIQTVERITRSSAGFDCSLPIAVAGLNPHASDGGMFGTEEAEIITPAINRMKDRGIDLVGPIGADSVFHQCKIGKYRCVISLYHDQGHIAAKTYDFDRTVSVTWDLPYLRTSVDHGTAFDIAGKGLADETGLLEAINIAGKYL